MWYVDRGDYRRAYLAAVEAAPQALTPDLAAILSVPQPVVLHSRYFRARNRILIMGQETSQNWTPLLAPPNEGDWARRAWAGQVGNVIDFDYGTDVPSLQFWQAFKQIRNIFKFLNCRSLAWSNIWKLQLRQAVNGRYSVGALSAGWQSEVRRWQRELFLAEMRYVAPDAIMFLTGGEHYVLSHMYPPAGPFNAQGDWQPITINGLDIPAAWTHHPNRHDVAEPVKIQARHDAATYLLDGLERRGRPRDGGSLDPFAD